jgi:hypothetical protein
LLIKIINKYYLTNYRFPTLNELNHSSQSHHFQIICCHHRRLIFLITSPLTQQCLANRGFPKLGCQISLIFRLYSVLPSLTFGIMYPRFLFIAHTMRTSEFRTKRFAFAGDRGQLNTVYFLTLCLCDDDFNSVLLLRLSPPRGLFPSGYPTTVLCHETDGWSEEF